MSLRGFESWGLDTAPPAGWTTIAPTGYATDMPDIYTTGGRFGGGYLSFATGGGGLKTMGLRHTFDAQRTWFVGVPLTVPDLSYTRPFLGLLSGATDFQVGLRLNSTGYLEATRGDPSSGTVIGTGTHTLAPNVWYFIEPGVYVDSSAGTFQVYVNGVLDIDVSGANTQALAGDSSDTVLLGDTTPRYGFSMSVGQVYVCDAQGSVNNTFLGDCRVIAQVPTGDGTHTDWTPKTGVSQYAMVDEIPPDGDTSYVASATPGAIDSFTFPALGVTGTVFAVKTMLDAERDDTGARTIAPVIRHSGTDYVGTSISPSAGSYGKTVQIYTARPWDSSPWQPTDLAAEFGVEVVS